MKMGDELTREGYVLLRAYGTLAAQNFVSALP